MSGIRKAYVIAAFVLVLFAGADLMGDLYVGALCGDSSAAPHGESPDDQCFCCCGHYVVPMTAIVLRDERIAVFDQPASVFRISLQPSVIYHPPRV